MSYKKIAALALSFLFLSACASSAMKARKDQQTKVAQSAKLYCEFVNGEIYPDVDVALNIEMAKRCDSDKPFSITAYKTPSENQGVMYCCSTGKNSIAAAATSTPAKASPAKPADKKEEAEEIE